MVPKHFKQSKMSIEGHTNAKLYFHKLAIFLKQIITQDRLDKSKVEVFEQMHTVLDELCDRLTVQQNDDRGYLFHGGESPDLADFRAYSVLQRVGRTRVMMDFLENREDRTLHNWFTQMKRLCDPDRIKF